MHFENQMIKFLVMIFLNISIPFRNENLTAMHNAKEIYDSLRALFSSGRLISPNKGSKNLLSFIEKDEEKSVYYIDDEGDIIEKGSWELELEQDVVVKLKLYNEKYTVINYMDGDIHLLENKGKRVTWTTNLD